MEFLPANVKVTVGLCVKNCEATVGKAVNSIIAQEYSHDLIEVLVVDGFSKDKTVNVIKNCLSNADLRNRIFFDNHGLGKARQTVVDNASGAYIIWIDGDMLLPKDFIRKQVEYMNAQPSAGIGKSKYSVNNKDRLVQKLENMEFLINFNREGETDAQSLGASGCIYRVKAIREAGGFDEKIKGAGEDNDAEYKIRRNGWKLYITNAVFYEKRRETWKSLWDEYFWHGYGWQSLLKKNRDMVNIVKVLPPIAVAAEITRIPKAYKLTHQKAAFLLPLHYVFKRIAWFFGFIKSRK